MPEQIKRPVMAAPAGLMEDTNLRIQQDPVALELYAGAQIRILKVKKIVFVKPLQRAIKGAWKQEKNTGQPVHRQGLAGRGIFVLLREGQQATHDSTWGREVPGIIANVVLPIPNERGNHPDGFIFFQSIQKDGERILSHSDIRV